MTTLLSSFNFNDDDNQVVLFDDKLTDKEAGTTDSILEFDGGSTLGGDDTIFVFGNFNIVPPSIEAELDLPPTELAAIDVSADTFTAGRNDTVVGAIQLLNPNQMQAKAIGIRQSSESTLSTGAGTDIVAGLASAVGADATGIESASIDTGSGTDIIVGAALVQGMGELPLHAIGMDFVNIDDSDGPTLIAGAGVAVVQGDSFVTVDGISNTDIQIDQGSNAPAIIVGLGLAIGELGGGEFLVPVEGPSLTVSGSKGANFGAANTGDGVDIVVGAVAALSEGDIDFTDNVGLTASHALNTYGGADIIVGVTYAEGSESGSFDNNAGISGTINTGNGGDAIIGVAIASLDMNAMATGNAGIHSFNSIRTENGEDLVLGVVDVNAFGVKGVQTNSGIAISTLDTGEDNDVVMGLAMPLSDGLYSGEETGLFGISSSNSILLLDIEADFSPSGNIYLGQGADVVYARGVTGGIFDVGLYGESGNDVFDIQNGFGFVNGGDDTDTLILTGNKDDYEFFGPTPVPQPVDRDLAEGEGQIVQEGTTDLAVRDVEVFIFDDGQYTYQELFLDVSIA